MVRRTLPRQGAVSPPCLSQGPTRSPPRIHSHDRGGIRVLVDRPHEPSHLKELQSAPRACRTWRQARIAGAGRRLAWLVNEPTASSLRGEECKQHFKTCGAAFDALQY